jgi:hypothetical protein
MRLRVMSSSLRWRARENEIMDKHLGDRPLTGETDTG